MGLLERPAIKAAEAADTVDMVAFLGNSYCEADSWVYKRHCRTALVWEEACTLESSERRKEAVGSISADCSSSRCQMPSPLFRMIVSAHIPLRW